MKYLTLEDVKKQLNIDDFFSDDDLYLESLATAAEDIVETQLQCKLSELDESSAEPIKCAMKLLIEHLYNNRGSETNDLPPAFKYICNLYKHYN